MAVHISQASLQYFPDQFYNSVKLIEPILQINGSKGKRSENMHPGL